jgi:hypothetical protein
VPKNAPSYATSTISKPVWVSSGSNSQRNVQKATAHHGQVAGAPGHEVVVEVLEPGVGELVELP